MSNARWISVNDRLPDGDQPCVIAELGATWGDEKPSHGIMSFAIFKNGKFMVDRPVNCEAYPTHWMPLPNPPLPHGG